MGTFNSRKRRRATMQNEPPFLADNGHINRTTRAHLARPRHCVQPHTRAAREQRDDSKQPSSQLRARLPASRTHKITHNATQRNAAQRTPSHYQPVFSAQHSAHAHIREQILSGLPGTPVAACMSLATDAQSQSGFISDRRSHRLHANKKKHIRAALASALLPKARLCPCTNSNC